MNDPLEEQLRHLRPARISSELRERLAKPPAGTITAFPAWLVSTVLAAAACVTLMVGTPEGVSRQPAMVLSQNAPGELLDERTVALVDDGAQRAWEIVETTRVSSQTLIADAGGLVALTQDLILTSEPREIHFD
jgi:hypothetical protein